MARNNVTYRIVVNTPNPNYSLEIKDETEAIKKADKISKLFPCTMVVVQRKFANSEDQWVEIDRTTFNWKKEE